MNFYKCGILFAVSLMISSYSMAGDIYIPMKKKSLDEKKIVRNIVHNVEYQDDEYGIWSGYHAGLNLTHRAGTQTAYGEIRPYGTPLRDKLEPIFGYNIQMGDYVHGFDVGVGFQYDQEERSSKLAGLGLNVDATYKLGYSIDSFLFYGMGTLGGIYIPIKKSVDNKSFSVYGLNPSAGFGVAYMIPNQNISVSADYRISPRVILYGMSKEMKDTMNAALDRKSGMAHMISCGINFHF
ncbi:hypothetical protein HUT03_05115 [Candidatus Liberibacter africanus]|uniref:Outer membrane protein beta-barrel domain-containing protein n=1 Tax=Candidatus Liberibacter africanus PTSAPSY TaxID=1277257 RepID=A0A0G3I5S7_LIBAF|nr:hypothetical protein [Candidatus Liberibacter africanus]AKK20620.1 hypothetical protein G293_05035 [Candidatus Liberibacter africanus PTSAPSY]QTP64301.1 hypothetical protein HUT03_05115 [Candidatus Liberibacter africanus]